MHVSIPCVILSTSIDRMSTKKTDQRDRRVTAGPGVANYAVAADAQRFVMVKAAETGPAPGQLRVVLNWFEELKRRVPAEK